MYVPMCVRPLANPHRHFDIWKEVMCKVCLAVVMRLSPAQHRVYMRVRDHLGLKAGIDAAMVMAGDNPYFVYLSPGELRLVQEIATEEGARLEN